MLAAAAVGAITALARPIWHWIQPLLRSAYGPSPLACLHRGAARSLVHNTAPSTFRLRVCRFTVCPQVLGYYGRHGVSKVPNTHINSLLTCEDGNRVRQGNVSDPSHARVRTRASPSR